jgi:AraC-like DNA-binding protein
MLPILLPHPIALRGGDLLVFPRDALHVISASAESPRLIPHSGVVRDEGEGPSTTLVCGYFEFDSPLMNPVLTALPEVIHIQSDLAHNTWLDPLLRLIADETGRDDLGADVAVDRLSDVLFIQVVRHCMRDSSGRMGLLAALADRKIARALSALHDAPESSWKVETLAAQAGMSRAAFARRFQQLMAMTPMAYVTHWRMQRAHEWLRSGELSMAAIAERSGYQSEAAFRKAYKQHSGVAPGAVRRGKLDGVH